MVAYSRKEAVYPRRCFLALVPGAPLPPALCVSVYAVLFWACLLLCLFVLHVVFCGLVLWVIFLFFAMTVTPPFVFGKPRNLKGFKSQGMVVCAVQTLEEGKVGR